MVSATIATAWPSHTARGFPNRVLRWSAGLWLGVAALGQWAFLAYIAAFYGPSTVSGHFEAWRQNKLLFKGYVAGDHSGNLAFAAHALLAGLVAFGGALQLMPQVRARAPVFHRWNGRVFLCTVVGLSLAGFYLVWVRHSNPSISGSIAVSLNGVLILTFAGLAWRTATRREIAAHRVWAMRLYLVANAQWFVRVGVFAWFTGTGVAQVHPISNALFFSVWQWGCFLVPLAVLELYVRVQRGGGPAARIAMAGGLATLTLLMAVGTLAFSALMMAIVAGKGPALIPG